MNVSKLIGFFGGFVLSNIIDTTLGELNEWEIVGAALIVSSLELSNILFYTFASKIKNSLGSSSSFYETLIVLNYVKRGIIYGLILEAFKLGSWLSYIFLSKPSKVFCGVLTKAIFAEI